MILPKIYFFKNIKIKLNSRIWMTLNSSVVVFQSLEPIQPQQPQWPRKHHFIFKKWLILMVESSLAPKWPILAPFCGMDHPNFIYSLVYDTPSVGGCWGHPILLFEVTDWRNSNVQTFKKIYWSFYPSEPFSFDHFTLIRPVHIL